MQAGSLQDNPLSQGLSEEDKFQERRKDVLILVMRFLSDHGLTATYQALSTEASLSLLQVDAAEHIDLMMIVQAFVDCYYEMFGLYPKLVRRKPTFAGRCQGQAQQQHGQQQANPFGQQQQQYSALQEASSSAALQSASDSPLGLQAASPAKQANKLLQQQQQQQQFSTLLLGERRVLSMQPIVLPKHALSLPCNINMSGGTSAGAVQQQQQQSAAALLSMVAPPAPAVSCSDSLAGCMLSGALSLPQKQQLLGSTPSAAAASAGMASPQHPQQQCQLPAAIQGLIALPCSNPTAGTIDAIALVQQQQQQPVKTIVSALDAAAASACMAALEQQQQQSLPQQPAAFHRLMLPPLKHLQPVPQRLQAMSQQLSMPPQQQGFMLSGTESAAMPASGCAATDMPMAPLAARKSSNSSSKPPLPAAGPAGSSKPSLPSAAAPGSSNKMPAKGVQSSVTPSSSYNKPVECLQPSAADQSMAGLMGIDKALMDVRGETCRLGCVQPLDQVGLVDILRQCAPTEPPSKTLFIRMPVRQPRQKQRLGDSSIQDEVLYALAGCSDMGWSVKAITKETRAFLQWHYRIDKATISTFFKNRSQRASQRKHPYSCIEQQVKGAKQGKQLEKDGNQQQKGSINTHEKGSNHANRQGAAAAWNSSSNNQPADASWGTAAGSSMLPDMLSSNGSKGVFGLNFSYPAAAAAATWGPAGLLPNFTSAAEAAAAATLVPMVVDSADAAAKLRVSTYSGPLEATQGWRFGTDGGFTMCSLGNLTGWDKEAAVAAAAAGAFSDHDGCFGQDGSDLDAATALAVGAAGASYSPDGFSS